MPDMLSAAEPGWPHLRLVSAIGTGPARPEIINGDRAELILKSGGRLVIDRAAANACFTLDRPLGDDELMHPFLAPAAAVMAHWHGRLSFHAGAFVHDGGVWALVGEREAGKSSTLAWLARNDYGIVTDDLLVLDATTAYAGPRSIDLRPAAAEHLGLGTGLGVVGTRERWRITLPQVDPHLPFRGWIFLSWGATTSTNVRRLSASECLAELLRSLGLLVPAANPADLLRLATLPAWGVARPRDWAHLEEGIEHMLAATRREP